MEATKVVEMLQRTERVAAILAELEGMVASIQRAQNKRMGWS